MHFRKLAYKERALCLFIWATYRSLTSRLVLPSLCRHNTASISPCLGPISSWKSGYCSSYQLLHMIYPKPRGLKWPFVISQSSACWLSRTDIICGFLGSSCGNLQRPGTYSCCWQVDIPLEGVFWRSPLPRELSPYSHSEVVLATCCFHRVADFKGESCNVYELTLNLHHFCIILLLRAAV